MLTLRPAQDATSIATARTTTAPRMATDLPPGRLRDRLEPVLEMRALLPVVTATSSTGVVEVRNDDEKVVVRVAVDEVLAHDGADAGVWVRVLPVRGYEKAAERARRAVIEAGAVPAESDVTEAALAAMDADADAARRPRDYGSKLAIELDPAQSAASAFLKTLLVLLDAIEVNLPGTLDDVDTEFLHDLRVAVRRSRSALKHAGDVLPDELLDCFRPELAWLQEITGPTRDLDVQLLGLADDIASVGADAHEDLEPFAALVVDRRREAQAAMVDALRSSRATALLADWRETLESLQQTAVDPKGGDAGEWGPWPEGASRPVASIAAKGAKKRHKSLLKMGRAIEKGSPPEALHDLRKQGKELRYLFELFGSLFPPRSLALAVKDLKDLQENLGEFQDTEVQRHALRGFGEELVGMGAPAGTILALAQLVQRLSDRQASARKDFGERFARFASAGSRAHFDELIAKAGHR